MDAIRELKDEHEALRERARRVRQLLASRDLLTASEHLAHLISHLERHVQREEAGIFTALRTQGEFVEEVVALEGEHDAFDAAIAALDADDPDLETLIMRLLAELDDHIEREDLGIFPVSVVTLGASGWAMVDAAHAAAPSFLVDRVRG